MNKLLRFSLISLVAAVSLWTTPARAVVTPINNPQITGSVKYLQTDSIANLRLIPITQLADGYQCQVSGYYAKNDGGGGTYVWNAASIATDNGGTVIQATGVTTGRWLLQVTSQISVKQFGAKGDWNGSTGTDDTTAFNNAFVTAASGNGVSTSRGIKVYAPKGAYKISNLTAKDSLYLVGDGMDATILVKTSTTGDGIYYDNSGGTPTLAQDKVIIENISVFQSGTPVSGSGIHVYGETSDVRLVMTNVRVSYCYTGVTMDKTIQNNFRNCECFYSVTDGFQVLNYAYLMSFHGCFSSNNGTGGSGNGFGGSGRQVYCSYFGCGGDHNSGAAFYFGSQSGACLVSGCGNEQNIYGAHLVNSQSCHFDDFFTVAGPTTINAVLLDSSNECYMNNISSVQQGPAVETYMVNLINGSTDETLSIGYQDAPWTSGNVSSTASCRVVSYSGSYIIRTPLTLQDVTLNGSSVPAIKAGANFSNVGRIYSIYDSGNTFTGFGMDASSLGPRIAGDSGPGGVLADVGSYSTDGAYTWTTRFKVANSGTLILKNGPYIAVGSGSPEASVTAPVGSLYLRTDGGTNTTLYVKESGAGNTGWIGK